MDYEQKYKESLERAKEWMAGKYGHYDSDTPQEIAEFIFPELKESEDERIRKELTDYIKSKFENSCSPTPSKNILGNWIAWLEKQNHDGKKWIYEDAYIKEREQLFQDGIDEVLENPQKYGLEKQGKQKTFDYKNANIRQKDFTSKSALEAINEEKVEPKFKVSKWYQCTKDFFGKGVTFDKNTAYYCAKEGCLQDEYGCHIAIVKDLYDNFKLWTIEDANDGDVLCLGGVIAIFKKYIGQEKCICYCSFCDNGSFEIPIENGEDNVYGCTDTTPANKEQRDILFAKMHEAGYEWNADKKDLTKE